MSICHSNSALAVGVGDCGRGGGIERNQGNDRTRERANISVFENDDRSKNRG